MKDDPPSKNTLKDDISCIIGSVDIIPENFGITLYIRKLKRFFWINDIALDQKTLPNKEFSFNSEAVL